MKLATLPTGNVTVTVGGVSGEVTVDTNSGSPGNQNTLTFTTTWDTGQTVTVAADEDDDTTNDSATLSHTAAGGVYNSVTGNVSVTVTDNDTANNAPTMATAIGDQSATAGTAFSYQFPANTFADADSDTLGYTKTRGDDSALPTWLSFTGNSRTFSGTPQSTDVGTLSVKVTANDGNGGTVSDTFNIVVSAAPPALSIRGGGAVTEGSDAVFTITASAAQGSSQTVLYTLSDAPGADFLDDAREGDSNSFLFPRNETSFSLRIPTVGDSTAESSGPITVTLRLRSSSNYVLGSPSSAAVRVNDDDSTQPATPVNPVTPVVSLPRVTVTGGNAVVEGDPASFTVSVAPPPAAGETLSVNVQVSESGSVVESGESGRRTVVV
ncbi:MAG: putative Ig domain-containing protein, partial [Gammaproteobacteria bacterium]|nr:putative Ig domain-containing protein [Gammaproteobacteria bacterium]